MTAYPWALFDAIEQARKDHPGAYGFPDDAAKLAELDVSAIGDVGKFYSWGLSHTRPCEADAYAVAAPAPAPAALAVAVAVAVPPLAAVVQTPPTIHMKAVTLLDWIRAVREDANIRGLPVTATIAAIAARSFASKGEMNFSKSKLAKDWGIGVETITKGIAALQSAGYLQESGTRRPGGISKWTLCVPVAA